MVNPLLLIIALCNQSSLVPYHFSFSLSLFIKTQLVSITWVPLGLGTRSHTSLTENWLSYSCIAIIYYVSRRTSSINVGSKRDTKLRRVSLEGLKEDLVLTGLVLSPRINSSEYDDLCMRFLRYVQTSIASSWTSSEFFTSFSSAAT